MTKTELVDVVSDVYGYPKNQVKDVLDGLIETIQDTLTDGGTVALPGFGTFSVLPRAARKGRNPSTGEPIDIAASNSPKFKAGKTLKEAVKG